MYSLSDCCDNKQMPHAVSTASDSREMSRMKQFIHAAKEYNKNKSDEVASVVSRTLQMISESSDINTFDPNSIIVSEFYVSLHKLMSSLDSESTLVWSSVSFLQQACRNKSAHKALIHRYEFLTILSRLLGDHLARDEKLKLLTLMQELTYGINITRQFSYLPYLLRTLTKWVKSGDEEVTCLSLEVLLNLCHQNLPVIYTLMRTVNTKHFLKTIMAMQNPVTDVQICKLLIILLEHINEVPKEDIIFKFVNITFRIIVEAFQVKDIIRLRHIVEFFYEVKDEKSRVSAVRAYDNYHADVLKILTAVETTSEHSEVDLECMSELFEFLHSLIELQIPSLRSLHARMVTLSLGWVQTDIVSAKSLAILTSIAVQPENRVEILEPLSSGLSILLHIVDSVGPLSLTHGEQCRKLTALLQLLRVLVINESIKSKITSTLKQASILRLFDALLESEDSHISEINDLYVHAIALVCALADSQKSWEPLLDKIFHHKQVHVTLANALYFSKKSDIKFLLLVISTCKHFPLQEIINIMHDIPQSNINQPPQQHQQQINNIKDFPIISEHLDKVFNRVNEALNSNQVSSIATSDVMQLFEFKMTTLEYADRAMQAVQVSRAAVDQKVTHIQHRVEQTSKEVHKLLLHIQQCNEEIKKQLKLAEENIATLNPKAIDELSMQVRGLEELRKQLEDRSAVTDKELMETHRKLEERKRVLDIIKIFVLQT